MSNSIQKSKATGKLYYYKDACVESDRMNDQVLSLKPRISQAQGSGAWEAHASVCWDTCPAGLALHSQDRAGMGNVVQWEVEQLQPGGSGFNLQPCLFLSLFPHLQNKVVMMGQRAYA